MKNRILQLLNIRTDEAWLVTNLFWLQFFQGVGVAIFNAVVLALFIEHFEALALPKVYLFAGALLLVVGFVYSKVEHALPMKKLVPLIIVFVAGSIFILRALFSEENSSSYLFVLLSWYYVIYLLTNLEFWGLAALQFDIRQSKRLFGMIGAGDIPAKLFGYSAVPFLVKVFSSQNMLVIAGISILCSLIFYFRLKRAGKMDVHVAHEHTHAASHDFATENWRELIKGFFGNRMIALVALLSFIVITCVTIISFSFYAEIKHEMHSDGELAAFISMFYAGGRIFAIFIRLILTGRLSNILGIKGSLLISPVILFVFLFSIIVLSLFHPDHHLVLYVFGLMAIITEVLKTSLQDPVFLSLMQPLSANLRLKGHTIVKGVMDPFALIFSGFMLFTLLKLSGRVDLFQLSYMVVTLLIVWVVMIFLVDREYVKTLIHALNKRYSVGQEIDLEDEKTREVLLQKISTGGTGEAIYVLNLIEKQYSEEMEPLVLKAFEHEKIEVRMEAIQLSERRKITEALPQIEAIIADKHNTRLLPEAIKAKCMLLPDELENFDEFLEDKDHRIMKAAIIGLMTSGGISAVVVAGQKLLHLIDSPHWEERKIAAEIIGELGVHSFYKPLVRLLEDTNHHVVRTAIHASGNVKNEKLMVPLMNFLLHRKHEKPVIDAMHRAGDVALKEIKLALTSDILSRQQQSKLILLCGRIGTSNAAKILDELVWKLPAQRTDIFHALHACEFRSQPHHLREHIDLMHRHLAAATLIIFSIREMEKTPSAKLLVEALHLELIEIRDQLLMLFSFVYNREKMMKARNAFSMNKRESIANALEVIEIEVPKELSLPFNKLFDSGSIEEKCNSLQLSFKEHLNFAGIINDVLNSQKHYYHRWTKAAALYSLGSYEGSEKRRWLEKAKSENDILLYETAGKLLAEMN